MREQLDVLNLLVKLTTSSALTLAFWFPLAAIALPPHHLSQSVEPAEPAEPAEPVEPAEEPEEGGGAEQFAPK